MNWLERARREIAERRLRLTATTAERNPTAVLAVQGPVPNMESAAIFGIGGSTALAWMAESEALRGVLGERTTIMEIDVDLSRDQAERALVLKRHRLH